MLYTDFKVGQKNYKLRLTTRAAVALEKDLGKNPLFVWRNPDNNNAPTLEEMILILYHSLKQYQPEVTLEDAYTIFDEWLANENKIMGEFTEVIVDIYIVAGIFRIDNDTEKN